MKGKNLIVISGPTASGKTTKAIELAKQHGTCVLSFDSRQCYKEMRIGTAQPSPEEQQGIEHFFIASHSIQQIITAADYERYALAVLQKQFLQHDTIIAVGGTGLYLQALLFGLDDMPAADENIVAAINELYEKEGITALQKQLQQLDPLFYEQGEIQNPHRVMRALAFVRTHQQSILTFRTGQEKQRFFNWEHYSIDLPRNLLYERINQRVDKMMQHGLLDEVISLLPYQQLKALQTVGYSELFAYLNKEINLEFAVEKIKQHTRNYAKRQITWFKKMKDVQYITP